MDRRKAAGLLASLLSALPEKERAAAMRNVERALHSHDHWVVGLDHRSPEAFAESLVLAWAVGDLVALANPENLANAESPDDFVLRLM